MRRVGRDVILEVRDTGVGIEPDQVPRLFERFHRIQGTASRTHEGTGIGLALVRELVKLHGGAIEVDSEPGRGTAFTIRIPCGARHLPADRIGTAESTHTSASAYIAEATRWLADDSQTELEMAETTVPARASRVLLADDNADMRAYVRRLLTSVLDRAQRRERACGPRCRAVLAP